MVGTTRPAVYMEQTTERYFVLPPSAVLSFQALSFHFQFLTQLFADAYIRLPMFEEQHLKNP